MSETAPGPFRFYIMDTAFYTPLGAYDFDVRCDMLHRLGVEGTYLTLWSDGAWKDLPKLAGVRERFGLEPVAAYLTLDLTRDGIANLADAERAIRGMKGVGRLELSIRGQGEGVEKSDPAHDDHVAAALERLLPLAKEAGVTLCLYPHMRFWMERVEDTARLCRRFDDANLRAVFCGFHWYAVDGKELRKRLADVGQSLSHANICGCGPGRHEGPPKTILPLDDGDLDNFAMLGELRKHLDQGAWVGLQGYSVGGDVWTKIRRSTATFRDMQARLREHAEWAAIRWG